MIINIQRVLIVSLIMALPMLISCGNVTKQVVPPVINNKGKVTLECVVPFDNVKQNEAFKNFETDMKSIFPNYDIHLIFIKGDAKAYHTKIKVLMSSDTPPDIFYSGDGNFTAELYDSKRIQPLEKNLNDLDYWNMVIPTAKLIEDSEHIYAVPMDEVNYNVMLINTKMFTENNVKIPKAFEELKSAVKQFKERNIIPIALGGKDGKSVYNMIEGFACTLDNKITSKIIRKEDAFSGIIFGKATTAVTQLINLGAFQEKTDTFSNEEAGNLFYSSKAAIYCTSSAKFKLANNKINGKVAVLYYPDLGETDGLIPGNIVSGGIKRDCGLLISSATKYPTEAAKLAVEMSKYYNKYLYEKQGEGAIIYNLANMGWTPSTVPDPGISDLMMHVRQEGNVNTGLFEENISSDKKKSIEEASTAFMTGLLSVSDYLEEMDISIKLK
ncbi:MAG: extracellular solute-binding protein [Desulfosporosinus sp.]|nr:extracellular solute-binding protein [Desulfosporosinus sp.]